MPIYKSGFAAPFLVIVSKYTKKDQKSHLQGRKKMVNCKMDKFDK